MCKTNMDKPIIVKTLNDVVMKDIKVKRPFTYMLPSKISQTVFRISHLGQPLLFQTPIVVIPYSYSLYDNERFSIDVILLEDDPVFSRLIDSIAEYILEKVQKKYAVPSILVEPCIFRNRMRFRTNNIDSIMTFDINNKPLDTRCIQTHDRMLCLFSISRFVVGESKCYFQLELHQIKRLESLTCVVSKDTCLISSPTSVSLDKYQKMLRFGIPIEAIKQKMSLDGLSTLDITHLESSLSTSSASTVAGAQPVLPVLSQTMSRAPRAPPAPPPPPPPLPPKLLPKVQVQAMHQPPKPKITSLAHIQPKPPSLNDILSMRERLRKVPKSSD